MNKGIRHHVRPYTVGSLVAAAGLAWIASPANAQDMPPAGTLTSSTAEGQSSPPAPPPSPPAVQGPLVSTDGPAEPRKKKGFFSRFIDEEDHGLDFSNFLAGGGFIPVPIIITEPAVDGGFGLAAAFISTHPGKPRQITKHIIGAFKTGNGSDGIGYFQSGYLFDGRLNYKFGIGHGKITLESFPSFAPQGVQYTNKYDYGILGSAMLHLKDDRFSLGPLLDFRKLSSRLDIQGLPDDFASNFNHTLHTGALGFGFHFDNRDNPLTPTKGTNAYIEGKFNRGAFGSDRDYETYAVETYAFDKFTSNLRFGYKFELKAIRGDFPVYFAPAIDLRGVQAMQYQGMNVLSTELELTWQLTPRWALLGFGGGGTSDGGSRRIYKDSGAIWAGGAGFRYKLARKLGFDAGMDFAYGPGGFVFYLQFGHAWSLGMD
ncbi:MAG TPA: hypothetical protein VF503_08295 [Sphingobium sp.]|uniref:hypothetical protein n=1 Tax=Sphingobium sp. TaxID=1912891 RepID=UPI002ED0F07E